jgi:hypothetical protein
MTAQKVANWQPVPGTALRRFDGQFFVQHANRSSGAPLAFMLTTELCHLSCVMCHFNGPKAARRGDTTIAPDLVRKVLEAQPKGEPVWFVSTGEFFSDPNALLHIATASALGLVPRAITHGQLLTPAFIDQLIAAGLREILISVDSIDAEQYARIRRGGRLETILDGCSTLRARKQQGADMTVGVCAICLPSSRHTKAEVLDFWRERVDYVQFVSEYYDVFRLRRLFFEPKARTDCAIGLIPLPSGKVAPCCAIAIYSHEHDVSWLPDLRQTTPEDAHKQLCDMYEDPRSKLSALCATCDWWVQFHTDAAGNTPIYERIAFAPAAAEAPHDCETPRKP